MPETPNNPMSQPLSPKPLDPIAPWLRDLVKDKPVVKPVVDEAPKLGVPSVVEESVKEEVKPVVPVADVPVVPATNVVPAVVAPVSTTPPSSPLK